ncbi:MAG: ribulose-phosphate 3-epimerase [Clostridia bacterium]|nr:ribulose-phosphate 3-epimerase [Clostridia bacterium]
MIKIAPSILAADPLNLEKDIRAAEKAGCDWIHVDIMDAHFVPNLAYSVDTVRRLREVTSLPLDVHLMMDHPETLMDAFLDAGASCLTIHAEIDSDIPGLLTKIRNRGRMAGIALKPDSPVEMIQPYIDMTDLVLMMTVEPGFGGQKLDARVIGKIRRLKDSGYTGEIEADGGIREDNLEMLVVNGLTVAVMGTALFRNSDMPGCIERLHRIPAGE